MKRVFYILTALLLLLTFMWNRYLGFCLFCLLNILLVAINLEVNMERSKDLMYIISYMSLLAIGSAFIKDGNWWVDSWLMYIVVGTGMSLFLGALFVFNLDWRYVAARHTLVYKRRLWRVTCTPPERDPVTALVSAHSQEDARTTAERLFVKDCPEMAMSTSTFYETECLIWDLENDGAIYINILKDDGVPEEDKEEDTDGRYP